MASTKPIRIPNFAGGLNSNDPTIIEDNQLSVAKNVFYDKDKILTTRRGTSPWGTPIADAVQLINECDAATNFSVSDDGANLATGTAIRGSNSLEFDVDVSASGNDFATLENSSLGTIDITSANGYLGFWLYVPAAFNTDLTDVRVRLGSDSSNYYEFTLGALTEDANNYIYLPFSGATTTGTPNEASIDYFRLRISYSGTYTDKSGILIDSIYTYSATSTKQIHSYGTDKSGYSFQRTDGTRSLLAGVGENIFEYRENEDVWEVIDTGLTDGLRFDTDMFKDVIYITNGTDNYRGYDGTAITEYASAPKGTFLIIVNDIGFIGGVPTDPSTIFYTNSNPTDLSSYPNNETVDEDNNQVLTGLSNVGALIIAFKGRSSYIFDVATPSIEQTDYDGGCQSYRSIARVENDMLFLSDNGVFSMAQRRATSGTVRADPLSNEIRKEIDQITRPENTAAIYWPATNNYYLAFNEPGKPRNTRMFVRSTLVNAWTEYTNINANDFAIYVDAAGEEHLLVANAYGGQAIEIEKGFDDQGNVIPYEISTKVYDFDQAGLNITYQRIDFGGFHSEQSSLDATTVISNVVDQTLVKTIEYSPSDGASSSPLNPIAKKTLASTPLGGASANSSQGDLTLYPFFRFQPTYLTGSTASITIQGSMKNAAFKLTKINLWPVAQPKDFVANSLYI